MGVELWLSDSGKKFPVTTCELMSCSRLLKDSWFDNKTEGKADTDQGSALLITVHYKPFLCMLFYIKYFGCFLVK